MQDEKFKTSSADKSILESTRCLHMWCIDKGHSLALKMFSESIVGDLRSCLELERMKEKMWGSFHELRVGAPFSVDLEQKFLVWH